MSRAQADEHDTEQQLPEAWALLGRLLYISTAVRVRFPRRLYLIVAAVRGLYTIARSTLMALARRAAPYPPARAARAAALRGLSPLSGCSRTG